MGDLRHRGLGGPWGDLGALGGLVGIGGLGETCGTWEDLGATGVGSRDLGGQGEVGDLGVGQNCAMADLSQTLAFFWRSSGPGAHQKSARRRGFRPSGDPLKNLRVENPPNFRGSGRFWLGRGLARPSEMSGGRHKIWHGQIWLHPRFQIWAEVGLGPLGALDRVPKSMKS